MLKKWTIRAISIILLLFFIHLCIQFFDYNHLKSYVTILWQRPIWLVLMTSLYFLSFVCKAIAWKLYVKQDIPLTRYLNGLFYSLFVNHIVPIKVGDVVRAGVISREKNMSWDVAIHSVVVMRLLDLLILGSFCLIGIIYWKDPDPSDFVIWTAMVAILGIVLWRSKQLERIPILQRHVQLLKRAVSGLSGVYMLALILLSWLLEAIVVLGVTQATGNPISIAQGIWVNSMTIAGQVFHLTPGGIGTYETVMSFALFSVGYPLEKAYHIALISHGFKFIFSYVIGIYILFKTPSIMKELMTSVLRRKEDEKA